MSDTKTLSEFLATYDPDGTRVVADVEAIRDNDGNSPFIIVRHGRFAAVLALMPFTGEDAHLCIDVHPFADGEQATASIFGMSNGYQADLVINDATRTTSFRRPSANLVAVLIGEQGEVPIPAQAKQGGK
jgi:hypothetical protein